MGPCQGKMCHGLAARVHARLTGLESRPDRPHDRLAHRSSRSRWPPSPGRTWRPSAGRPCTSGTRRSAPGGSTWATGSGRSPTATSNAEVRAVREAAGLIDVSTLGKLDVQGADAGAFLDWLHPNRFSDLRSGRVRYRAMLDDAGIVLDDGTVARLGDERFFVSTTTGNLEAVEQWLGWWLAGGASRRVA